MGKDIPSNKIVSILHPQIKVVGGAMKQMLYLAEYLSHNNTVSFFTFSGNSNDVSKNDSFSISSSFSSYPLKLLSFFIIAWKIRKSDYIICGNSPMHFVAVVSKIFFRSSAIIIWWHHHFPWYFQDNTGIKTYFKKIIESYCVKKVDTIVGNSRFLQKELQNIYKRKVYLLYPLVDQIFYNLPFEKKAKKNKKVLFAAGRWEIGKGISDIFQLYDTLSDKYFFQLKIAGNGKELEFFKKKYKDDSNIVFLGVLDSKKIQKEFMESDIFLFCSKIDSFGLVIIESLLSGTPVISYDLGEARFIIKNKENGYRVKNIYEYVDILEKLLSDVDLLIDLKKTTRKSVVSNYSMKNFQSQLLKIIFKK